MRVAERWDQTWDQTPGVPIAPSANAQLLTATHYIFVHSLW